MDIKEKTIKELIDSINNSIEDMHEHPTKIDRIPSNFEIMVRGISDSKAIDLLFSPRIDDLINSLFRQIDNGDFSKIIENKDTLEKILDSIFGPGSFRGKISSSILNNIQYSVESEKYQMMKGRVGRTITALKRKNLIIKNLEKGKKNFKYNSDEYKKYTDAVYAIKQVIKFVEKIYRSRRIINKKVYNGLHNIIHESIEIDEVLE